MQCRWDISAWPELVHHLTDFAINSHHCMHSKTMFFECILHAEYLRGWAEWYYNHLSLESGKWESTASWIPPTIRVSCTSGAAGCRGWMWVGNGWYSSYFYSLSATLHEAAAVWAHSERNGRWPCLMTTAGVYVTIIESHHPHKRPSTSPQCIFSPNYKY